jgi:ribose 5-phosphate isomerase A
MRGGISVTVEKKAAGRYAADQVSDGMAVGLGTGSTVLYALEHLSARIRDEGIRIVGVPTSHQTAIRAREYRIPLATLDEYPALDLAIDGADQVDTALNLIKGRGGALVRERCVAEAAERFLVVVDEGKMVRELAGVVPVEVIPFAATLVTGRLVRMGAVPVLREGEKKDGPVMTDNCNWIIDTEFGPITLPAALEDAINTLPGVVSCGIFAEFREKTTVVVGKKDGSVRLFSG